MKRYISFVNKVISKKSENKKIIIWGSGINGVMIGAALMSVKIDMSYFVDSRAMPETYILGHSVYLPEVLKSEVLEECFIIVSPHHIPYIKNIDDQLLDMGYQKNYNFINYVEEEEIRNNDITSYFDPFLGFAFKGELDGFKITGNIKSENRVVILGNCTSLQDLKGESWVDYFYLKLREKYMDDCVIFNGACAGYSSSQELIKLVRDVIELGPRQIIILDGVIDAIGTNSVEQYPYYTTFEKNILDEVFLSSNNGFKYRGMQDVSSHIIYGIKSESESSEIYYRNHILIEAIADAMKLDIKCFLQPALYNEYATVLEENERKIFEYFYIDGALSECVKHYNRANRFYHKVKEENEARNKLIDLTKVFNNMHDTFLDEIHYSKKGNQILADKIFDYSVRIK